MGQCNFEHMGVCEGFCQECIAVVQPALLFILSCKREDIFYLPFFFNFTNICFFGEIGSSYVSPSLQPSRCASFPLQSRSQCLCSSCVAAVSCSSIKILLETQRGLVCFVCLW